MLFLTQAKASRAVWSAVTVASCLKPMLPSINAPVSTVRTSANVARDSATSAINANRSETPRWLRLGRFFFIMVSLPNSKAHFSVAPRCHRPGTGSAANR
ncbi:hypothetical protein D3C87_1492240 [compost metagenome]